MALKLRNTTESESLIKRIHHLNLRKEKMSKKTRHQFDLCINYLSS